MAQEIVHLTREGYRRFEAELDYLQKVRRNEVAARLRQALEEGGDLMENAEYADAKNEQSLVEGRIQELESLLSRARIIEDQEPDGPEGVVRLNSVVTVQEEGYEPETFRIVGAAEADPRAGLISDESPMGQALLGKKAGEIVKVQAPDGVFQYRILSVD